MIDAARALAPRIRESADEAERERRLPRALVDAMAEAGIFRMAVPRRWGGGEVDVATYLATIEELSRADGAAGWCAMIAASMGVFSAYLPDATAREIYGRPDAIAGGAYAPTGTAVMEGDDYQVNGRWAFASGCQHCTWLVGGCVITDGGKPRLTPDGTPDFRILFFPAADVRIIDTWTVSGLRGTGSHDITVEGVRVPAVRSFSLLSDRPRLTGALYAFPAIGILALGISAVALGIARAAIDVLVGLAGGKTPSLARRKLAERAAVQTQVAEAEASLRAARAFVDDAVGEAWRAAEAGHDIDVRGRAFLRLAATHATTSAAGVVDRMYNAGGGTSLYATSPLQRCFRDVHAVTQHLMVGQATYEQAGRVFLGLPVEPGFL